jgi:hypothetical protein
MGVQKPNFNDFKISFLQKREKKGRKTGKTPFYKSMIRRWFAVGFSQDI